MFEELRDLTEEAKRKGLAVVVWSYPRGAGISKEGETAIDVVAYAAQIAAQLGAHIIKVKPPTAHIEQDGREEGLREGEASPSARSPSACATSCRAPSTAAASSSSRAARPRRPTRDLRRDPRHPRRRRLRLDHRPQLLPAAEARGARVPRARSWTSTRGRRSERVRAVESPVARVPARRRGGGHRLRAHDGAGRAQALRPRRRRGDAQGDGHAADARHGRHRRGRARRGADALHRREGRAAAATTISRSTSPSIRSRARTSAPPARRTRSPCWRRRTRAACCTRPTATWRRSSSGRRRKGAIDTRRAGRGRT